MDKQNDGILSRAKKELSSRYLKMEGEFRHKAVFVRHVTQNVAVTGWKGVHQLLYGNPLASVERIQGFLRHPVSNLCRGISDAEIQALSELWELSWGSPTYSNPRKVYKVIRVQPHDG